MKRHAIVVFALFMTCIGCERQKTKECNQMIAAMNSNTQSIKDATAKINQPQADSKALDELGGVMDKAADGAGALVLNDPTLQTSRQEYQTMLRTGAEAARTLAKAATEHDVPRLDKAMGDISKVQTSDAEIVKKVNAYCKGE